MVRITIEKFPKKMYVVNLPHCDELRKMVEPFLTEPQRGITFVDGPKYYDFLHAVCKYDKETVIVLTTFFDAPSELYDVMLTQETKTFKVSEMIIDNGDDYTVAPALKRTRFSDANPKQPEVTFVDADNDMVRCCFKFNRQIIDIIRSIKGREYNHPQRSWFIPKGMVNELSEQLQKLREN